MSEKKQLAINITANFIYMLLNYMITFFLTSFIVSQISSEAYGFISLCNNVVNYATLVTVALNSVAGRFIAIEMHKGETDKAKKYFSSTLISDVVICTGIIIFFIPISLHIGDLFDVPVELISDVTKLFLLITFNLIINVICSVYSVSTFITNKLYLTSFANAFGNIARALLLVILMGRLKPSIVYVGITTVVSSLIVLILNICYTKKLCPDLKIDVHFVSFSYIKKLLASGIWNSITKLSQILSDGLDMVISNVWIGAYEMGQLSIAYTISTVIATFISMIINVFNPKLTEYYAKGDTERVVNELKTNMKMTAFFGNVFFFGVVVLGKDLFQLWVPSANINMVYSLAILATVSVLVSAIVSPLSNVFLLTNKLKMNSLVWLGVSVFDAVLVIILVSTTNLGVYAVAGVSKIVGATVNLIFLPIYAAHCLKINPMEFYKVVLRYVLSSIGVGITMAIARKFMGYNNSWLFFLIRMSALGAVGLSINYVLFFDKSERSYLKNAIKNKVIRRKEYK